MNIGMNLAAVSYWATEEPFIDRFHTAGAWVAKNAAGKDVSPTLALNADGDPTKLTDVSSLSVALGVDPKSAAPIDQYVLTYDGDAGKVSIDHATIVSQTAGKVVFNYTGGDTKPGVVITFTQLNASDPVGDVHVVRADQQALFNAGEIFNPDFVAKVSQWGVVRFMDWQDTNESTAVTWGNRTTLDAGSWAGSTNHQGVPLEAMVKLANEAHVDMWYNVPTKADDAYVTNALTYIRDHLDPGLKVHIEYSNEVWNAGFKANGYAQGQANALWGNGTTVTHGANLYYGYRSAQVAGIAHDVFSGTHAGQAVDVLAGQASWSGTVPYMLDGVAKAGLGSAASLFQDYAIAPYFGGELSHAGSHPADKAIVLGWAKSGAAGLDAAFHELEYGGSLSTNLSLAAVHNWLTSAEAAASSAGLTLVAYEGGASLDTNEYSTADRAKIQDFFGKLMNDPRMGELYSKLTADFHAVGGGDFVAYNDVSGNSTYGYYGALDSIYQDHSARYDALLAARDGSGTDAGPTGSPVSATPTTGDDLLTAKAAGETINALAGNDTVNGGAGADHLLGGDGKDLLAGGVGNDFLQGGSGDDTMTGGDGNDRLQGDGGHDLLTGGAGADRFVFSAGTTRIVTTGTTAYAMDEITDFTHGTDTLALPFHPAAILAGSADSLSAAASWAATTLHSHAGTADVAAVTVGSDTYLFYDDQGAGGAYNSAIHLDHIGAGGLTLTDFA